MVTLYILQDASRSEDFDDKNYFYFFCYVAQVDKEEKKEKKRKTRVEEIRDISTQMVNERLGWNCSTKH